MYRASGWFKHFTTQYFTAAAGRHGGKSSRWCTCHQYNSAVSYRFIASASLRPLPQGTGWVTDGETASLPVLQQQLVTEIYAVAAHARNHKNFKFKIITKAATAAVAAAYTS